MYFSRHDKSVKSTYVFFTECREILSGSKRKEDLETKYYFIDDEEITRISRFLSVIPYLDIVVVRNCAVEFIPWVIAATRARPIYHFVCSLSYIKD